MKIKIKNRTVCSGLDQMKLETQKEKDQEYVTGEEEYEEMNDTSLFLELCFRPRKGKLE